MVGAVAVGGKGVPQEELEWGSMVGSPQPLLLSCSPGDLPSPAPYLSSLFRLRAHFPASVPSGVARGLSLFLLCMLYLKSVLVLYFQTVLTRNFSRGERCAPATRPRFEGDQTSAGCCAAFVIVETLPWETRVRPHYL